MLRNKFVVNYYNWYFLGCMRNIVILRYGTPDSQILSFQSHSDYSMVFVSCNSSIDTESDVKTPTLQCFICVIKKEQ